MHLNIWCIRIEEVIFEAILNWLASQTHQGGISTPNDVAIGFQSTAEALRTFHALNEEEALKNIMAIGQEALNAVSYHSTESLSRQIIAGHENGDDISAQVNELLALQNPDGGFGEMADFDSTVLNTAFALEALAMAAPSETQTTERAITFLTQHQNPSGSFVLNAVNESAIYVTALASSALQRFLFKQQLLPYVEAANDYLYKNQTEGGGWETDWETAIALLAVASATADTSFYKPAAQVLRTHQDNKGSWGEDAYTTALALRALQYVKRIQFPVEPDKGILTGQIVDDNSGLPLAKVDVILSPLAETTAQTESDGSFNLTGLEPGSYTLKYQLAGYQSASQEVSVSKGQFAELGTVRLAPLPDVGIISGTLTDTNTKQPLSGVLVEVTGAVTASALTDEQGYYAIVSPPGPVTVSAKLSGYDTLSGTGTVTRGVTLSFSPAINPTGTTPSNPEITVKGLIQDSETGTPLTDAIITIIGTEHSGQTDDTGAFEIPGVTPGELSLKIAIDGYQTGLFTVLAPPGGIVDLGTTHLPKTVAAATTTLIGQVKDANTGEPIEGASVSIEALESSALTAENGSYRLEEIVRHRQTDSVVREPWHKTRRAV